MMKTYFCIGFFLVGLACSDGRHGTPVPDRLLSQDQMVELLKELFVLDAHIRSRYPEFLTQQQILVQTGDSLLLAHNVTPEDFKASMSYYAAEREQLELIYERILDDLTKMMGELE